MPQQPDVPLDGLYGDLVMDHYRHPRNRESLGDADVEAEEFNPFCGDRAILQLKLDSQGKVLGVSANAEGCSIIQAATSMLSGLLQGKSLGEVEALGEKFREAMKNGAGDDEVDLGDLRALQVVRQYPVRIKCALLPLTALEEGIKAYRKKAI
ncbi:MAG: SUF system NifU family Fe-S cluster assembly protein [Chloroflexi bacterium]|jgi:nitrogen fixation NifU-like protein|uniref:NIF system FeS cluster assembly NifU N-terminal domain-containing protein n=1 Tax=marine metagenome TaxID=408172 RepID=A0A382UDE2_9ZZZZ|nr:SUF system NifU family Fe-S cluster assembly protein [Chloroflexota bacterium]MDP6496605.1 SUF system NifU family Fe-S cluster assembly protein [Dehalococcoidia bacterium]MQG11875.1 SUF system NifU family Fe-S cluster assembly protein [SAR202 cluster bacterium]MQG54602.1 SUF system NifU family Fe-S cluster assembly protein [SAR202 cluster bacterium]|tara:strand:+ start:19972 stop:20430 length:459 start_codon:yes stop_codon:yes gene_type:complete